MDCNKYPMKCLDETSRNLNKICKHNMGLLQYTQNNSCKSDRKCDLKNAVLIIRERNLLRPKYIEIALISEYNRSSQNSY